jgi:hypothetical protein
MHGNCGQPSLSLSIDATVSIVHHSVATRGPLIRQYDRLRHDHIGTIFLDNGAPASLACESKSLRRNKLRVPLVIHCRHLMLRLDEATTRLCNH